MWLREYIFNALLQPIHCIIYVVIFGSVMQLVTDYPLYGLIALGFMVPAEKFIRKMFGFEKAGTVGGFNAMAGTAALMGGIQKLTNGHKTRNNSNNNTEKIEDNSSNKEIKTIDSIPAFRMERNNDGQQSSELSIFGDNNVDGENSAFLNSSSAGQEETNTTMLNNVGDEDSNTDLTLGNAKQYNEPINLDNLFGEESNRSENKIDIKNGIKAVSGHYARRLNNSVKKMHPVRALRRGITYGAGAATLGAIGLAAGIASGDPSKALQYTMAGGMVGGNLGRNIGEKASNVIGIKDAANTFRAGALGKQYLEKEMQKEKSDFKNNASNYNAAVKKVNLKGWENMSQKDGIIDKSLDYGINDIGTMCNIYKTQQELVKDGIQQEQATEMAFRAYKLNEEFGDYNKNSKTQENLDKILTSKGYSSTVKTKTKDEILNLINVYKNAARG